MHSNSDKIFGIGITLALIGALIGAAVMSVRFWTNMGADLDDAAVVPLILGVVLSLVLGGAVVGIYLYGRRQEINRDLKNSKNPGEF
ncbi:MAG: hypothetical protein KA106_03415 [Ferrovibrio sp.]|nr:hypothetical protein [Ferrovibrio sp.]